jgi:hypothetical protein
VLVEREGDPVGHGVDGVLEEVGDVERHAPVLAANENTFSSGARNAHLGDHGPVVACR